MYLRIYIKHICVNTCVVMKKKYILKKFFNFSEAFILYAKISHRHPRIPEHPPTTAAKNYFVPKEKSLHTKLEIRSPATKRKL